MRIGDDIAVFPLGRVKLALKLDMLVESTDVPRGMTYRQAARKAVAMCVSDFASKGVKPAAFMVSLGLRRGTTQAQVKELGEGFLDAEREWRVKMVGGDTNEAGELVIDCAMAGLAGDVVTRRGARPGDALVVGGPFGYPPSGLRLLEGKAHAEGEFRRTCLASVFEPDPHLEGGLALAPYLTSSMDSSDGLSRSLHTLAEMSRVGFDLDSLPTGKGVEEFALANGLDSEKLVLAGGEEFFVVGTAMQTDLERARRAYKRAGGELIVIGKVTSTPGRVTLRRGTKPKLIADEGWTHLG
jgi:thiamine-monophosphate kinase